MPLQRTLFDTLCKFNHKKMYKLDGIAKDIRRYFSPDTYRTKRKSGHKKHEDLFNLSVEEIITFFDELIQTNHPESKRIADTSRQLSNLTAELMSFLSLNGNPGQNKVLKSFVKKHIAQTDVIVSFNWDTLLDRVLSNQRKKTNWDRRWGYGYEVGKRFKCGRKNNDGKPGKYPKLFKLHGSVNWVSEKLDQDEKETYSITPDWGELREYEKVVMMPPKMVKREIFDPVAIYQPIWNEAEKRMIKCKKIVFVGYSFPPADFAVSNMLRRVISSIKTEKRKSPTIVIVDPNVEELAKRFEASFNVKIDSDNRYLSLKSYLSGDRV